MIVAIYVQSISLLPPVNPVNRIDRPTPEGRHQNQSEPEERSFASMLKSMIGHQDTAADSFDERS